MSQPAKPNPVAAIIILAISVGTVWYLLGGGVENKVANDAVKEYEITQRDGTKMDACVHAGLVAAAYLQAKDEDKYREWKATEKAGLRCGRDAENALRTECFEEFSST